MFSRLQRLQSVPLALASSPSSWAVPVRTFVQSAPVLGLEEFFDQKKVGELVITGRGWTVPELRRKSFEDLHKLYYVLYKERNLLLTDKEMARKFQRPVSNRDEQRYLYVKRGMAGIKKVLAERKKIAAEIAQAEGTTAPVIEVPK